MRYAATAFLLTLLTLGVPLWVHVAAEAKNPNGIQAFEATTAWKMMEALNLDKETAQKIYEVRKKYLAERRSLQKSLNQDLRKLRTRVNQTQDAHDQELASLLNDIRAKRGEIRNLHDKQYEEIASLLTVRQRAQLILFLKDFRRDMRSFMRQDAVGPANPSAAPDPEDD